VDNTSFFPSPDPASWLHRPVHEQLFSGATSLVPEAMTGVAQVRAVYQASRYETWPLLPTSNQQVQ